MSPTILWIDVPDDPVDRCPRRSCGSMSPTILWIDVDQIPITTAVATGWPSRL
jgi:hypothetical protein